MKIFVVEDDPFYANLIEFVLEMNPDNQIYKFTTGQAALEELHVSPDVITIDYSLPDMTGAELLRKIKSRNKKSQIVIISSQQDVSTAIELLKEGAYDYIVKDDDTKERLWNTFRNINGNIELQEEVETLREKIDEKYDFSNSIIGESAAIQRSFKMIAKAARTSINVTISGETGTGKEVVAHTIHFNSDRKSKKLVAVNMAAVPKDLIESELFGHEKGAFTGASTLRIGKFEEANGGTLFLDEIGELELNLQAKLLRVIQEGELIRVGGNKTIKFNARIITATHKDLSEEVKKGTFRQDLFYRLIGLPIELPPLRERENDVLLLAQLFLKEFSKANKTPSILTKAAKKKLLSYSYPGNVRELKSILELSAVMADGNEIEEDDITFNSVDKMGDLLMIETSLKLYNQKIIQYYLDKYNDNVLKVADILDIGKSKIYQMIKEGDLTIKK